MLFSFLINRLVIIAVIILPSICSANYVPEEFKHFYKIKYNKVRFLLPNETEEVVGVESNFREINSIIDVQKLQEAIYESGVEEDKVALVIKSITDSEAGSGVSVSYNSDNNTAEIKVPASFMREQTGELNFTTMKPDESALMITNRAYVNGYNGEYNSSLNTEATLGLDKSHIDFSGDFTSNNAYNIQTMNYQYDLPGYSIQAGYSEYASLINNSTSSLDFSQGDELYSVSLFTNDNLLLKDIKNGKKIYFDMRSPGTVELVRNGVTIYSDSVGQGQNKIDYSRLPRGNYTAELVLKPNGFSKETYNKRINNSAAQTSQRGYDYAISFNKAKSEHGDFSYESEYADLSGMMSFWDDRIILGGSVQVADDVAQFGTSVKFVEGDFSSSLYTSYLHDGHLTSISGNWSGFSLDFEQLNLNTDSVNNLTGARYGDNDYKQATLSYSTNVGFGNFNFYANKYYEEGHHEDTYNHDIDTLNLSANFHTILFMNIGLDLGVTSIKDYSNKSQSENVITTSITIPLSDLFEYSSSVEHSNLTGYRFSNNLNYNDNIYHGHDVNVDAGLNVAEYLDGNDSQASIGGDVSANGKQFDAHAFANISNDGYRNISADIESTAVITRDGFYATSEKSSSYLILNNSVSAGVDKSDLGLINVQSSSGAGERKTLSDDYTLVGLDDYAKYKLSLDTEVSGFNSTTASIGTMYSYPGTVKVIDNNLKKVKTFLAYFEDFNETSLDNVDCLGDGCVSVNRVGEGVYSISVQEGARFRLTSNNQICNFTSDNDEEHISKCFPTIKEENDGMQLVTSGFGTDNESIYYIGVIKGDVLDGMSVDLSDLDIEIIKYPFNGEDHVFAKLNGAKKSDQVVLLNKLQQYASIEEVEGKYSEVW